MSSEILVRIKLRFCESFGAKNVKYPYEEKKVWLNNYLFINVTREYIDMWNQKIEIWIKLNKVESLGIKV